MTIEKFINDYRNASKKEEYFARHIVTKYIPYEQKIAECKSIVDVTSYTEVNGRKVFKQNMPIQYLFFICRLISDYTDIDIPDDGIWTIYNELKKNDILEPLLTAIPKSEYAEFNTVLRMVYDDEVENYRSFAGFLDTKFEILEKLLETFQNAIPEETVQGVIEQLNQQSIKE